MAEYPIERMKGYNTELWSKFDPKNHATALLGFFIFYIPFSKNKKNKNSRKEKKKTFAYTVFDRISALGAYFKFCVQGGRLIEGGGAII